MDNFKALSCIAGALLINITLGTFYSYGNIVPYVASYMRNNGNPSVTSEHGTWLTAAFLLGQGISSVIGSYIEQWYSSRVAVIIGCILHCTSTFMTIWAVKINFTTMIIVYGFGSGIGSGCAYMASIIAAQKWFPLRKGFFTGVIVAGFGFGGLIFTNLQTLYMNPKNLAPDSAGYFPMEVYDKVPNLFLYMGLIFAVVQTLGCLMAFSPVESHPIAESSVHSPRSPISAPNESPKPSVTINEGLPEVNSCASIFKHREFYTIGLMMILVAPGVTFVNSLGKRYGQSFINDDQYLATVVAVSAIANAGGRLTWGILVDKLSFSTCFIVKCALFATLIALFPFGFVLSSKYIYMIWMFGMFFGFSGGFVLFPVFVEQVFGTKYSGTTYGILFIAFACSSILTSFLIQTLVGPGLSDKSKNSTDKLYIRLMPCALITIAYCVSCLVFYAALPVRRLENAIKRRKEQEAMKRHKGLFNRADLFPIDKGTLAEKTAPKSDRRTGHESDDPNDPMRKENSLGSIVKFNSSTSADGGGRLKAFNQPTAFKAI